MKSLLVLLTLFSLTGFAQTKAPAPAKKQKITQEEKNKQRKHRSEVSPEIEFAPKNMILSAKAGNVAQGVVLVKNKSTEPQTVQFTSEDLFMTDLGAATNEHNKKAIVMPKVSKENIVISQTSFELKPGEEKKITMSVKIPKEAKEEMFFKYSFMPTKESRKKAHGSKKDKKAGVSFFANLYVVAKVVPLGSEKYDLDIQKTELAYDKASKQVRVNTQVKNTSNVHLTNVAGTAVVLKDNKKIGKLEFSTADVTLTFMPKAMKRYQGAAPLVLGSGAYEVISTFTDPEGKVVKVQRSRLDVK